MTHEEKIRALLPVVKKCPNENCNNCPSGVDCNITEIELYRDECFNALKDKVILKEDLLIKGEIIILIASMMFGLSEEQLKLISCLLVEAQNKKAGVL